MTSKSVKDITDKDKAATELILIEPGEVYGPVKPRSEPTDLPEPEKKRPLWRRIVSLCVWFFLGIHLYAIALRVLPVPGTILMVQRAMSGEDIRRQWVSLNEISPHLPPAVMGGEDSRFCDHVGIDFQAIGAAMDDNAQGGRRRGGSTITQQTAKNVFLWNGGGYARKAVEAWAALYINTVWGKRRTMEVYLNVAEWGDGIFGAEAAAQQRFGKPASELTLDEAALLASVLPSPYKWRVDPPSDFVNRRADVLKQRAEVIRTSQYDACLRLD